MMTANYMQQNRFNRLDIGAIYQIDLLLLGLTAVTNPAKNGNNSHLLTSINAFVGLEFEELRFGFSYDMNTSNIEIGRASCRERVKIKGGAQSENERYKRRKG